MSVFVNRHEDGRVSLAGGKPDWGWPGCWWAWNRGLVEAATLAVFSGRELAGLG